MRRSTARDPVLVLRALHLGDLLVAVPALCALRRHYPDRPIVLATSGALAPIAALTGAVDEVLPTADPSSLRWDRLSPPAVAVNLHGTGPGSHRALDATFPRERIGCRAPGWDGPDWNAIAARHPHERDRWCAVLRAAGIDADSTELRLAPPGGPRSGVVIVHPGAQFGAKRWPPERFAQVAAALRGAGEHVVVTGSAAETSTARLVTTGAGLTEDRVLAGRTDLGQLAALVAGAALVISGDTGIAHLASAFGTPSVVLFGPVGPDRWGPPAGGPHAVLGGGPTRRGDPFAADPDPALLAVTPAQVIEAAAALRSGAAAALRSGTAGHPAGPAATSSSRVVERPGR